MMICSERGEDAEMISSDCGLETMKLGWLLLCFYSVAGEIAALFSTVIWPVIDRTSNVISRQTDVMIDETFERIFRDRRWRNWDGPAGEVVPLLHRPLLDALGHTTVPFTRTPSLI